MKPAKLYDVVGLGSPIIDYLLPVSESFLKQLPGPKHGMMTIGEPRFQSIIQASGQTPKKTTGGSCANTLEGLANLGHRCVLHGGVGNDAAGEQFLKRLQVQNIEPRLVYLDAPTYQVLCLIAPDGHRTFRAVPGAGAEFAVDHVDIKLLSEANLVHIEGYLIRNEGLLAYVARLAKAAGAFVSLDLASHEIVHSHRDALMDILRPSVDIVFCNEDEARILEGTDSRGACELLRQVCSIAVVLQGKEGCLVGSADGVHQYPAYPVQAVDTTGAGDFFASGFLHGFLTHQDLATCAHYGAVMGNAVVQVLGAEVPPELWAALQQACSPSPQ